MVFQSTLKEMLSLKCSILERGIKIDGDVSQRLQDASGRVASSDYGTTQGIPLRLSDEVYVNAPFREKFVSRQPLSLELVDSKFVVKLNQKSYEVTPYLLPAYFSSRTTSGTPLSQIINTHTDRARINPVLGCAWTCTFCDAPFRNKYQFNSDDDIREAIAAATHDPVKPARHILVSGGTPRKEDMARLDGIYRKVVTWADVPVDVMMAPREDFDHPKMLVDCGVNDLFVNLEGIDQNISRSTMKQKYNLGVNQYLRYLEAALDAFGKSRVLSLVIVGIEPLEKTVDAVKMLAERGVIPVLSPFRPAVDTPLESRAPLSSESLLSVLVECRDVAESQGMKLGPKCLPCNHNCMNAPDGSDFYIHY